MSRGGSRRTTRSLFGEHPQVFVVLAVFFTVMVIYMAALIDLQAVRPDRYRDLAEDQSTATRSLAGFRGQITDREGYVLAASTPTQLIVADPQIVEDNDPAWTAALLAPILELDAALILERLKPASEDDRYNVVTTTSDPDVLQQIRSLVADSDTTKAFAGIVIRPEEDRLYPAGSLARPLVGRVDPDEVGRSGLEEQLDELLRGTSGSERYERGIFGSISVGERTVEPAARGYDVTLTLDHRIQYGTEAILIDTCEKLGAAGASAIVSNPKTGEIYGMASVARTDPTHCGIASYNKAAIDTFEPGSVMKLVAFAAAADSLEYSADDTLMVPGSIVIADKPFYDHPRHEEQSMSLADALGQSSNVAAITLSQQLGADTYYRYATDFGFGADTGMDFSGESTGVLREPAKWLGSDAGSIVIGQGMTVNLMQLAAAFNTVGNEGTYIQPSIVSTVVDAEGNSTEDTPKTTRQVISAEAAAETLKMLSAVTSEGGTGFKAAIEGYSVAGKTGTAWKVFDNGSGTLTYGTEKDRRYVTTFGGLVPAESPEVSVVLVIDEPRTATSATTAAAPTFAQIAQYALRVLAIAPADGAGQIPMLPGNRALVRGTPAIADDPVRSTSPEASAAEQILSEQAAEEEASLPDDAIVEQAPEAELGSAEVVEAATPTTQAPTTQAPTTQAPTTQPPTTAVPVTTAPAAPLVAEVNLAQEPANATGG